jgi:hypothetical protein
VQKAATAAGALKAQIVAVSGAFHTSRMNSAAEALKAVMAEARMRKRTCKRERRCDAMCNADTSRLSLFPRR